MLRRLSLIGLLAALGCVPPAPQRLHYPGANVTTGIDFSAFTARGFMFTPEKYLGPHESIGLITVTLIPEARGHLLIQNDSRRVSWTVDSLKTGDVLEEAYKQASSMGANAIVNLSLAVLPQNHPELLFYGIELKGFAIRRLSAAP